VERISSIAARKPDLSTAIEQPARPKWSFQQKPAKENDAAPFAVPITTTKPRKIRWIKNGLPKYQKPHPRAII
jgi:hypothetical protein